MRKVEIDNVEEMIEKIVTKDGKVGGLKRHAGKKVIIIVTKNRIK
jgi:putative transposon-encoded protein